MARFDECFSTLPDFSLEPKNFLGYWENRVKNFKKIPIELEEKKKVSRKVLSENNVQLTFQSHERMRLTAHLLAPKTRRKTKPPIVVIFPDYLSPVAAHRSLIQANLAQFVLQLRGVETAIPEKTETGEKTEDGEEQFLTPGLFSENLDNKDQYFMGSLFLDAYRALEVVRLLKDVDPGRIGIWGQGIGANMALFVSVLMKRTTALFLENPSFFYMENVLNNAEATYAREIRSHTKRSRKKIATALETLSYFDGLYLARQTEIPTGFQLSLGDSENPPEANFAAFHAMQGEKNMYLITKEDTEEQDGYKKQVVRNAVSFFKKYLLSEETE